MDKYLAIDVHAQSCTLAVVGPAGKRLMMDIIETSGRALVERIRQISGRKHLCIEEGTQSEWLYQLLAPYVEEMVIAVPQRQKGHKSDATDAWTLAELLRRQAIDVRVFKAPTEYSGLRAAVRGYGMLTNDAVRIKNRLKAIFRSRGISGTADDLYNPEARMAWIPQLPLGHAELATLLGEELDAVMSRRKSAETWLHREAAQHPIVSRLATAPGLGVIRAAQVVAVVITPHRFRTKRQFWSYCGLGIVTRSSADWTPSGPSWVRRREKIQTRGLNQNRNSTLKMIFKGAALSVVTRMLDHPLHRDYQSMVAAGIKPDLARVTIARRIAAAVLAMWKTQEDYDPEKHRRTSR